MEKRKMNRWVSGLLAVVIAFFVIALLGFGLRLLAVLALGLGIDSVASALTVIQTIIIDYLYLPLLIVAFFVGFQGWLRPSKPKMTSEDKEAQRQAIAAQKAEERKQREALASAAEGGDDSSPPGQGNGKGWPHTPGGSNTQWADSDDFGP
jgi:hypothetical protein